MRDSLIQLNSGDTCPQYRSLFPKWIEFDRTEASIGLLSIETLRSMPQYLQRLTRRECSISRYWPVQVQTKPPVGAIV